MAGGTITAPFADRGFGFIKTDAQKDLSFHFSALTGLRVEDLRIGQRVQHEEGEGPKGPRAISVRPA